jgi:SAM-dependent methyltransferase
MTILDIGGGRHPVLAPDMRPAQTTYVGLDPSPDELAAAPSGAYDRAITTDAAELVPDLVGTVDLAVSWQVFEHVGSLAAVMENARSYLRPGGALISFYSGRWAMFAVANRLMPRRLGLPIADRIGRRRARNKPVFPAAYDSCSYSGMTRLTREWSRTTVTPFYRAGMYLRFSLPLMRTYLVYEDLAYRSQWRNAATHYLLVAER